jgi:hypothetical protein
MIWDWLAYFLAGLIIGISLALGFYFLMYEIRWAKEVEAFHIAGERLKGRK